MGISLSQTSLVVVVVSSSSSSSLSLLFFFFLLSSNAFQVWLDLSSPSFSFCQRLLSEQHPMCMADGPSCFCVWWVCQCTLLSVCQVASQNSANHMSKFQILSLNARLHRFEPNLSKFPLAGCSFGVHWWCQHSHTFALALPNSHPCFYSGILIMRIVVNISIAHYFQLQLGLKMLWNRLYNI